MKFCNLCSRNEGFSLIELFVTIAIISILAAIAIPNYIAYRDKGYCTAAETDAENIIAALSDYFANISHYDLPDPMELMGGRLSGSGSVQNSAILSGTLDSFFVIVTDGSGRCPQRYQALSPMWNDGKFTKAVQ